MSDLNKLPASDFEKYLYDTVGVHEPTTMDVEPIRPPKAMQMLGTTQAGLVTMVAKKKLPRPRRVGYGRVAWHRCDLTV